MTNNFEGWKHINTAPKDKEILMWDGRQRHVGIFTPVAWVDSAGQEIFHPTHWRGCPPPPVEALPDDDE